MVLKRSIELPYVDDIEVDPVPEIVEMKNLISRFKKNLLAFIDVH